jgi:hypothetical protein
MKQLIFLTCLLLQLATQAQTDSITPARLGYDFFTNKTITFIENDKKLYPEIKDGKMVVFQYSKQHAENPEISDDELYESVQFEVDPTWNNFIFKKKLDLCKPVYNFSCFCIGRGYYKPVSGYIKGKKLPNGNYFIEGNLTIKYETGTTKKVTFKGEFKAPNAG